MTSPIPKIDSSKVIIVLEVVFEGDKKYVDWSVAQGPIYCKDVVEVAF